MHKPIPRLSLFLLGGCLMLPAQTPSVRSSTGLSAADLQTFQHATEDLRANHVEQAITGFQLVTHNSPRFAEAYLNLGLALAQASRNEEAARALQTALSLKPSMRGARLFLAISEYKLAHFKVAALAIREETTLNPSDAQAWMWQGIIDLALGHLAVAVEDLNQASSLDARNVEILYHRGRAALALSRQSYEALFQLDPQSWHVHQILAEAYSEQDRDGEAVEEYKLAIAGAPPQNGLYEALGSALWRTGKYQDAEDAFETALKIDPNDTLTMYKLGCLRVDLGDGARGKPLLDRVMIADPSLKLTLYYLGRAEAELGNDRPAVEAFKKVIAENIDEDTTKRAYFQLSRAYRRLHDSPAAAAAQAQYRLLDQQGKDAMQEKLAQHRLRADRDTGIPAPVAEPVKTQP